MEVFSEPTLKVADPNFQLLFDFQHKSKEKIKEVLASDENETKHEVHSTIFHELLRSRLSAQDKSFPRLIDEARIFT